MKTDNLTARSYGVDVLRIMSILMIVVVHIFTQGGILNAAEEGSANWYAAVALRIFLMVDVNCFAMITGYVSVNSKFRISRVLLLWLEIFAYSVLISAAFQLIGPNAFPPRVMLLPILSGRWWYMTAYFGIVFFLPFMSILFDNVSRRQASLLVLALVCLFSLLPSLLYSDPFKLQGGYDMVWLGILALIGGYIRRFEPFKNIRRGWLIVYALCMVCVCAWKFIAQGVGLSNPDRFVHFTSVFTLVASAALLLFFSRVSIANVVKKVTNFFTPMVLGVYLIHAHPCVWNYLFIGRFAFLAEKSLPVMLLGILVSALGIFVVCAAVDKLRGLVFKLLRIDRLAELVGDKLTALAEKVFK